MTIDIKKIAEEITIQVTGRLDTITAPALEKTINENIRNKARLMVYVSWFVI